MNVCQTSITYVQEVSFNHFDPFGFYDQLGCVSVMLGKCRIHRSQVCLHGNLQHKKQHDGNHHNVLTKDDAKMISRTHFENEPTLKLKVKLCADLQVSSNSSRLQLVQSVYSLHCRLLNQIYTYLEYLVLEGLGPFQHLWPKCMFEICGQIQCKHAECW